MTEHNNLPSKIPRKECDGCENDQPEAFVEFVKNPVQLEAVLGYGRTTNQKGFLGVDETREEPEVRWGFDRMTNQKAVLRVGKTPKEL